MILINNRDNLDWHPEMTVQDMLDAMGFTYKLITVVVNGEMVDDADFDVYQIPDHADVRVIHVHHGG